MYNRPLCEPLKECTVTYSAQSRDWVVYKHIIRSSIHQHFRMLKLGFVTNFPFSKTLLKFSSLHPISYWKRINLTSTSDDTHNYLVPTSRIFLLQSHRALYSCSSYMCSKERPTQHCNPVKCGSQIYKPCFLLSHTLLPISLPVPTCRWCKSSAPYLAEFYTLYSSCRKFYNLLQ